MDCSITHAVHPNLWGRHPAILLDLAPGGVCLCPFSRLKGGELLPRHCNLARRITAGGIISAALSSLCRLLLLGAALPAGVRTFLLFTPVNRQLSDCSPF